MRGRFPTRRYHPCSLSSWPRRTPTQRILVSPAAGSPGGPQVFRAWAGLPTPAIHRLVWGAASGPVPGGGPTGPGGGGPTGPGSIPGMEPVPPGSGGAGAGGIPGMEPAPGPGGQPTEPVPAGGGGAAPIGTRPMLRLGSSGDAVREAQALLVRRGASVTPDGQSGPLTQRRGDRLPALGRPDPTASSARSPGTPSIRLATGGTGLTPITRSVGAEVAATGGEPSSGGD